jgi:hypothetical protein
VCALLSCYVLHILILTCVPRPACLLLLPADNLVSKLNAQKGATAGDIIKQMGWYNLFTRGLGLRIIMIGTLTGLQVGRQRGAWGRATGGKTGVWEIWRGRGVGDIWAGEGRMWALGGQCRTRAPS